MSAPRSLIATACLLCVLLALTACSNPDAAPSGNRHTPQSAGEPPAPRPAKAATQSTIDPQPTPSDALRLFASLFGNWSYRTLSADQRRLAKIAVGAARLTEQQAAAGSTADHTLSQGRIWNQAQILSISTDRLQTGCWVIVTKERTGSDNGEYEGLPAADHVTIARVSRVHGGYAISEWSPQN